MYQYNTEEIAEVLTPIALRQPRVLAWHRLLLAELSKLYSIFTGMRYKLYYTQSYNTTVGMVEYMLRREFKNNGIYLTNGTKSTNALYIHRAVDNQPEPYIFTNADANAGEDAYIFMANEIAQQQGFDYTIYVPTSLQNKDARIRYFAEKYRPAGKFYNIIYY